MRRTGVNPRPAPTAPALDRAIRKPLPARTYVDHGTNAETRWESVDPQAYETSQADLFVRNHTVTPAIDAAAYALRIFGDGLRAPEGIELSLDELKAFPRVEVTTVLECTGNGRSFFATQQGRRAEGTPWTMGAVGTVRWTGVRLRDVLQRAGVLPEAVSVMAAGLDPHYVTGGVDHGPVRRPIGIEKALDDVILAWAAGGEPLLPDHGFPLRLVVPGWIGIASTKWLGSLEVSTSELSSPWSTTWYNIDGPLSVMPVRSAFELAWGARIRPAQDIVLSGRSWSGAAPIAKVEISTDDGATWGEADLRRVEGEGWTQWTYIWRRPPVGEHEVLARATDEAGRCQPDETPYNPNGYLFDAVVRHPVTVV